MRLYIQESYTLYTLLLTNWAGVYTRGGVLGVLYKKGVVYNTRGGVWGVVGAHEGVIYKGSGI